MARVLVTGCAGFLASHLCDALIKLGHTVFGVDNLVGGDKENIPKGVIFFQVDCCNERDMDESCVGIDFVYHLAAFPHEGLSVFSPVTVTRSVYDATVVMATAAIKAGVKRFVFTSSMARYGWGYSPPGDYDGKIRGTHKWEWGEPFTPFAEHMEPAPVDPYGIAKVAAEKTLECLGNAHGMEVVILVPHNVIGERQKYDDPYRNVASIMINRMLQGKGPIIYGDGEQKRCFTYVGDVMDSFVKAGFIDHMNGKVVNIGPDEGAVTINELSRLIADIIDPYRKQNEIRICQSVSDRTCEVKQAWCSSAKARGLFGYETKTTLRDALAKMVAWIKERGPKPFQYHLPLEIVSDKTPKTWKDRLF